MHMCLSMSKSMCLYTESTTVINTYQCTLAPIHHAMPDIMSR